MGRLLPLVKLFANPSLRRVGIGFGLFNAGEIGEWVAVVVYAYGQGGARASGLLVFAMLAPCTVLAPIIATFSDRYQPGKVLVAGFLAQAAGMAALAIVLALDAPPAAVYVVAVLVAPTFNATRPTTNVVLPLAVHTPDELTAANAATGWIENIGGVAGPLLTSLLFVFAGPGLVVAVLGGLMFVAALIALPLARTLPPAAVRDAGSPLADAWEGVRVLAGEPGTAALIGLITTGAVFWGALDVVGVILSISVLGIGDSGVGLLNAAWAVGGIVAVVFTLGLVGRRRLAPVILVCAAVMGGSIALIVVIPQLLPTLVLLAAANIGRSMFDVTGRTLLQRTGSPHVLGRTFGLLEGLDMLALAVGSLLVSILASVSGPDAAVLGMAAVMPLAVLLFLPVILKADARATVPIVQIGLLRSIPLFRPLPAPQMEGIARAMEPAYATAGEDVVAEGDPGELFYMIAAGSVEVSTRKAGVVATLHTGEGFGEIALLHEVPRTATVTALEDTSLYTLAGEDFLRAVTGVEAVHTEAHRIASDRLAETAAAEE